MAGADQPLAGSWYETDEGETFRVVRFDAERRTVEMQFLDGSFAELELEAWQGLNVVEVEPPEEWHASMDDFLAARRRRRLDSE